MRFRYFYRNYCAKAFTEIIAYGFAQSGLAGGVPNPAPKAPPGLTGPINTLLAWWKWGALVAGVFGLIGCGAMMAIGRRNRSNLAADGAAGDVTSGAAHREAPASGTENVDDDDEKLAIFGALRLYLDFINLFISLLRIFGNSR